MTMELYCECVAPVMRSGRRGGHAAGASGTTTIVVLPAVCGYPGSGPWQALSEPLMRAIAMSLFLLNLVVTPVLHAQASTSDCAETRKVLAFYEQEAAQALETVKLKELEGDYRYWYGRLGGLAAEKQVLDLDALRRLENELQRPKRELARLTIEQRLSLQAELRGVLEQRIQKATSVTDTELQAQLDRIAREIELRETRLASLGCSGTAPSSAAAVPATGVTGTWQWVCCNNSYSGTLVLKQDGSTLSGTFDGGEIGGQVSGATVTFKRTGSWGQQDYTLTLSADGRTLSGSFEGYSNTAVDRKFSATKQ